MDDTPALERRPGGNVEPLDRGFVAKEALRTPALPAERFELHDPREDLTYRMKTFFETVTKANQIGASRFTVIDANGKRSTVSKVDGTWQRDDRAIQMPAPAVAKASRTTSVVPALAPTGPTEPVSTRSDAEAERAARISRIEAALNERYVIKQAPIRIGEVTIGQTEYRHRGDTSRIAFTESTFRLSTDNNNPSVARSMVDVAEARGWKSLRVSGNEDFKRMVWLEASLRGVWTVGYDVAPADHELLRREREARQINRIEPLQDAATASSSTPPVKQSERGSGGRKAVLAALEAVLVAKNVPERQREAVMAAAAENLAARLRNGETHRVKIYDKAAPSLQRPVVTPAREVQRDRERSGPAR
ncbi:MAG: hypothetical protein K8R60_06915 [Burkholderiales bacterium]|nr:hypothetical protein [Burkholderiales bacterium]